MRIAIIATCGLALLWASNVRAQEPGCPELPPISVRSSELSVKANASLVSRFLSALGVEVARNETVDDVLARYSNHPDDLLLKLQLVVMQCRLIMADPTLGTGEKREALNKVFHDVILLGRPPSPSPVPPPTVAFDISGRYSVEARFNVFGPGGTNGMSSMVVLDIQSGSGDTFSGSLYDPEPTFTLDGKPFHNLPNVPARVEGQVAGSRVTFIARTSNGTEYMSFEGEYTGDSIEGRYILLDPAPSEWGALPVRLPPSLGLQQDAIGEFVAYKSLARLPQYQKPAPPYEQEPASRFSFVPRSDPAIWCCGVGISDSCMLPEPLELDTTCVCPSGIVGMAKPYCMP